MTCKITSPRCCSGGAWHLTATLSRSPRGCHTARRGHGHAHREDRPIESDRFYTWCRDEAPWYRSDGSDGQQKKHRCPAGCRERVVACPTMWPWSPTRAGKQTVLKVFAALQYTARRSL